MIIEEITEDNYLIKIEEGNKAIEEKIKKLENQVKEIQELFDETDTQEKRLNKIKRLNIPQYAIPQLDWKLFLDPTIWSYKLLKDKQNAQFKFRGFQDKIINDKHPLIVAVAANQIGKTWTACIKAIHHAYFVPNASVLIVSRSEPQAIYILDEIKWMLRRANLSFQELWESEVENRTELHIKNVDKTGVSVIRCLPPTQRVLSYPATLIICDEIGYWEIERMDSIEFFEKVIVSRIQDTKYWKVKVNEISLNDYFTMGQIFCISSTNAQQGVLWKIWNDSDFNQYRYNWLANPEHTIEEYQVLKRKKPSDIFDSVYAADFSSATGGFILLEEYEDAIRKYSVFPPPDQPICLGGDFAGEDTVNRDVDETVLFGGIKIKEEKEEKVKIVYYNEFPLRVKKEEVYEEIKRLSIAQFSYDKAGVGDSVKNDLIDKRILSEYQIDSLTYSLPNKSEVYYNMKHLFEQRKIIIPDIPKLKEQLLGLRFKRTEGGHLNKPVIMVHHKREGLHDDFADALANCCWATMRSSAIPVDLTIIKREPEKIELAKKGKGTLTFCSKCDDYFYSNQAHECLTI